MPIVHAQDDGLQILNTHEKGGFYLGTYTELGLDAGVEWSQSVNAEYNILNNLTLKGIANIGRQHPKELEHGYWMPSIRLSLYYHIPIARELFGFIPVEPTVFLRYGGSLSKIEWNTQIVTGWCNDYWNFKFGLHHRDAQDLTTNSFITEKSLNPVYLIKYTTPTLMGFFSIRATNTDYLYTGSYNRPGIGVCYTLPLLGDAFIWTDLFFHASERFSANNDSYGFAFRIGLTIGNL